VHAEIEASHAGSDQGPLQTGDDMIEQSFHTCMAEDSCTAE
jgi:hypothetical protein